MTTLLIIGIVIACILSVCVRVVLSRPLKSIHYAIVDSLEWLRRKKWRNCKTGQLICLCGLFGKGKTLGAVHYIVQKYKKYNGRMVWDSSRKKWVKQVILVFSNVELKTIPYKDFTGLGQMVSIAEEIKAIDLKNDTLTCIWFLGDEFSVQLNSRSFKSNIDPLFLNTLLTCRHHHISLVYTAQRFNHVDALLRQVTSFVIQCNKKWRIMVHSQYDAFALENAVDPTLVKPMRRFGWFIDNADYSAYDTLACVGNLSKSCKENDMLSEVEILELQQNNGVNMEAVVTPSKKFVRSSKKRMK